MSGTAIDWLLAPHRPLAPALRAGEDYPRAVLEVMRRDGLVVPVAGGVYLPADVAGLRTHRRAALHLLTPPEAVVGLLAAAWAHGCDVSPAPVDLLVSHSGAVGALRAGVRVRQIEVPPVDVVTLDGLRLTTPTRTAVDVARWLPEAQARPALAELLAAGVAVEDVLGVLQEGRRYRNAVRARRLLTEVSAASSTTRTTSPAGR
jgi:hypothetical protein